MRCLVCMYVQLKAKLGEYDEHYKLSETATSYLQAGIDRAHKSVDEVRACVCAWQIVFCVSSSKSVMACVFVSCS